jgi:pectinesterase
MGKETSFAINRRMLIASVAAAAMPSRLHARPRPRWDATISTSGRPGTLRTIGEAIERLRGLQAPRIFLEPGTFTEKPLIDLEGLEIAGSGPDSVVTFAAAAGLSDPAGRKWGTSGSATMTVTAPGISLSRLTIRNGFDYIEDRRTGASGGSQAVALSLSRGADRIRVTDCAIEGYQDTLYVQEGCRALFRGTTISGNVDFIFGGALARFDRCEIRSRFVPGMEVQGYVAAPSTRMSQPTGLVFHECRLTREDGLPGGTVYLGRPWRAGNNMDLTGAAAYIDCWMDAHVAPAGWASMGFTDPSGQRRQLTPEEARLFEYASNGPGAASGSATRRLLTDRQARTMLSPLAFGDWHP